MSAPVGDDEITAALAAVRCYIEQSSSAPVPEDLAPRRPGLSVWRAAAALEAQRMPPSQGGLGSSWGAVERTSRANRWSYGIVGQ